MAEPLPCCAGPATIATGGADATLSTGVEASAHAAVHASHFPQHGALAATDAHGVGPLYAQLLGLGLLMISVHCAGMCGPIVLSLRFGVQRDWQRGRAWLALGQLGSYQLGRAVVYAGLGAAVGGISALAGDLGGRLGAGFHATSRWLILVVALGFIVAALLRLRPRGPVTPAKPGLLTRLGSRVARGLGEQPLRRAGIMGLIMAFIPCMIPIWTLGLAAVSASPLHGALLMLLLVAMTTPALLPFALAPGLLPKMGGRAGFRLQTAALLCSGIWLSLIGLAAVELIPHAHTPVGGYTIKWW